MAAPAWRRRPPGRDAHAGVPSDVARRYTSVMKLAVPPRHRRLLALCACSAALHLALLEWFAGQDAGAPAPLPAGAEELVLRLAPAPPARASTAGVDPAAAAPRPAAAATPPAPSTHAAATPLAGPAAPAAAARSAAPAATPGALAAPEAELPAPPEPPLPGRYRVRLPAPVLLSYTRTLERAGAAAVEQEPARLDWRTDGQHYSLRLDGVGGRLESEGQRGDAGLLPRRAYAAGADWDGAALEFDHPGGRVRFAGGADGPALPGIQDRASMLLQLAGMGLAAPEQLEGIVTLVLAEPGQATLVRWQAIGEEEVATGIGRLATRHLAEVAAPGRPRLEVWLAPARDWLPVKLRLVGADGSVATQTLAAAEPAPLDTGGAP